MPHLKPQEITEFLEEQWFYKLTPLEKEVYTDLSKKQQEAYYQELERLMELKNSLRRQIYEIRYGRFTSNPDDDQMTTSVKPSGKLKFMSAYRFFRRDRVPYVKDAHPDYDGKQRQDVIKAEWRTLSECEKFAYVIRSRADRERALYAYKLTQLKEELLQQYPELAQEELAL